MQINAKRVHVEGYKSGANPRNTLFPSIETLYIQDDRLR